MVNFISKFNSKASNIGLFISDGFHLGSNKGISSSLNQKIKSFLRRIPKNNKQTILSFDLSESQKCFLVLVKKNLKIFEMNNLGAQLKSAIVSDSSIKNVNFIDNLNISNAVEILTEFAYGFELKSYKFEKYKSKKNLDFQKIEITSRKSNSLKSRYKYLYDSEEIRFSNKRDT